MEHDVESYRTLRSVRLSRLKRLRELEAPKPIIKNEQYILLSTRTLIGYSQDRLTAAKVKYFTVQNYSGRM